MAIVMPVLSPLPINTKGKSFIEQLLIIVFGVRQWKVVGNWYFRMPNGTLVIIPDGFIMDLASTPKFLWGILDPTGVLMIPGIVHDFCYRYDYLWTVDKDGHVVKWNEGAGKIYWDKQFFEINRKVNGLRLVSFLSWLGLFLGGGGAWNKNRELNAPELCPVGDEE